MTTTAITKDKRRRVPVPTERVRLPCPALFPRDPTGATEEVDEFLARIKPWAAAKGMQTLAEVADDTDPDNARINAARVKAAEGLLRVAGAMVEQVQVTQIHKGPMRDMKPEMLIPLVEEMLAAEAKEAEVIQ